jgi:two-component system, NtrC family, sensor kinase
MRLMQRYTAALVAGIFAVLAVYAYLQARTHRERALTNALAEQASLATTLSQSASAIWSIHGEARAVAHVASIPESETGVRVRWVWADEIASDAEKPIVGVALLREALHDEGSLVWHDTDERGVERLVTYAAVPVPSQLLGALELSRSLAPIEAEVARSTAAVVIAMLVILVVAGALALVLGVSMIGRPVAALARFAGHVGEGDFSRTLVVERNDELGTLTAAMNAMCAELRDALEARVHAVERLRHADRLSTVGQLAAGLAHELGTPLNTISIYATLIESGEVAKAPRQARIIREQGERMAVIVNQLLDFSRPRRPHKTRIDIVAVVRRTVEVLQPLAKQAAVALELDRASPARLHVEADDWQLQQVLMNLIVNAIQAMPNGGTIRHSVALDDATPPTGPSRRYVKLVVADQGSGIAPEHLPHIFDPYFSTKEMGHGTGLGLAVAFGIVREHQGFIDVKSRVGEGTVFSVYLPREGQ